MHIQVLVETYIAYETIVFTKPENAQVAVRTPVFHCGLDSRLACHWNILLLGPTASILHSPCAWEVPTGSVTPGVPVCAL